MPRTDANTAEEHDGENYFGPVEREDWDLDDAIKSTDKYIGRSNGGITRQGLFGGKSTTDDPEEIQYPDEGGTGLNFLQNVYRAVVNIDEFPGEIRFHQIVEDVQYGKPAVGDPFGSYRFDLFLADMDNRMERPLVEGLVEYFETEYDGREDVRGVEFEFDTTPASEKFRAIFPWLRREDELKQEDYPDDYEGADPVRSLAGDLKEIPYECRGSHRLTVTVHYHHDRYDDQDFTLGEFYGADEAHLIENDRRSTTEQALDNASVKTRDTSISYQLTISVSHDDIDAMLANDDRPHVTSTNDVARALGRQHFANAYSGQARDATIGLVGREEGDKHIEFTLAVQATLRN